MIAQVDFFAPPDYDGFAKLARRIGRRMAEEYWRKFQEAIILRPIVKPKPNGETQS
ncbi:MAG: hypothetical protein ACYTEX_28370 [Planctomycetota bacterium]|jgi:hypothetical protein